MQPHNFMQLHIIKPGFNKIIIPFWFIHTITSCTIWNLELSSIQQVLKKILIIYWFQLMQRLKYLLGNFIRNENDISSLLGRKLVTTAEGSMKSRTYANTARRERIDLLLVCVAAALQFLPDSCLGNLEKSLSSQRIFSFWDSTIWCTGFLVSSIANWGSIALVGFTRQ